MAGDDMGQNNGIFEKAWINFTVSKSVLSNSNCPRLQRLSKTIYTDFSNDSDGNLKCSMNGGSFDDCCSIVDVISNGLETNPESVEVDEGSVQKNGKEPISADVQTKKGAGDSHPGAFFEVDDYVWEYLQTFFGNKLFAIFANGKSKFVQHYDELSNGKFKVEVQSKCQANGGDEHDKLIDLYQKIHSQRICKQLLELKITKEMIDYLRIKAKELEVILVEPKSSISEELKQLFLIGPSTVVNELMELARTNIRDDHSHSGSSKSKECNGTYLEFVTPNGIKVFIGQGNLVEQTIDAIVNPANTKLRHGGGAAHAIQEAAGSDLAAASKKYIKDNGNLKVSQVIHTTSGNLSPKIKYVIHVAGPDKHKLNKDDRKCRDLLFDTFLNCLVYANNELQARSIAIPAISSGIFGVPMDIVTKCAWDALCEFELRVSRMERNNKHLTDIKFINTDQKTVSAMHEAFLRELNNKPEWATESGNRDGSKSRQRQLKKFPVDNEGLSNSGFKKDDNEIHKLTGDAVNSERNNADSGTTGALIKENYEDKKEDECTICRDELKNPKELPCKHKFCTVCIGKWFNNKPTCPNCTKVFGILKGNQPKGGTMSINYISAPLSGYNGHRTIVIDYSIPGGIQSEEHPNPGQGYSGAQRKAYLPDNSEGREVLDLLKKAFDNRLIFTVGRSTTNGRDNVVTWNDIHHKTSPSGVYGYPDDTYLKRVKEELAAKGIVP